MNAIYSVWLCLPVYALSYTVTVNHEKNARHWLLFERFYQGQIHNVSHLNQITNL